MIAKDLLDTHKEDFEKLYELYMEYNSHTNISAIRDKEDIYEKHFLDSLMAAKYIAAEMSEPKPYSVIDIGTGGGFPSLPLAIALKEKFPSLKFTALDSVAKKTKFINIVKENLALENLEIITARAEELAHKDEHREAYDMALSRALAYLPSLLEYSIPFLKNKSMLFAFKKKDSEEEINDSQQALKLLNAEIIKQDFYEDKQIITVLKTANTHRKYPRLQGLVGKSPL